MVKVPYVEYLKKMPPLVDKSKILKVCVDDFALKKRYTYGTVMINWDTHRIIDIIPSRDTREVCEWLKTYPNLQMISRDGASTYALAGRESHSTAIQVTDRFHLVKNLAEIIDRYIKNSFPSRVEIPAQKEMTDEMKALYNTANRAQRIRYAHQKYRDGYTAQEIAYLLHAGERTVSTYLSIPENEIPEDRSIVRERQHQEAVAQKQAEIELVKKRYDEGKTISEIALEMHHTRKTITNYLDPNYSPVSGHYDRKRPGKLTPYEKEVTEMRSKGKTYDEIYQIISKKGYSGSIPAIRMYMQKERVHKNAVIKSSDKTDWNDYVYRKTLTQLVYKKLEDVKLITKEQYDEVLKKYPALACLYHLVKEFNRILFSKKPEELDNWILYTEQLENIPELKSYIEGLKQDIDAVKNAILYDYNNGLAEGSVTKIKLIKRIMYGRNSFELLKSKVLLHELLYGNAN